MKAESLENISNEELIVGASKVLLNAEALSFDGKLLFDNARYSRGYTLFQLSNEEVGKIIIIHDLLLERHLNDEINYSKWNKDFRSHTPKTRNNLMFNLFYLHILNEGDQDISAEATEIFKHVRNVNALDISKNRSLYVDIDDNKFCSPVEIYNKESCKKMLDFSILSVKLASQFVNIMKVTDYCMFASVMRESNQESQEEKLRQILVKMFPDWKFPSSSKVK